MVFGGIWSRDLWGSLVHCGRRDRRCRGQHGGHNIRDRNRDGGDRQDVPLSYNTLLLFPGKFNCALACTPFILGKAASNAPAGGRFTCYSGWRGRRGLDRTRAFFREDLRGRRRVSPASLRFDNDRLRTTVAEALFHDT